jgi:hypothetical protein
VDRRVGGAFDSGGLHVSCGDDALRFRVCNLSVLTLLSSNS